LHDVCFTASTGRLHASHRLAIVASHVDELCAALSAFLEDRDCGLVHHGQVPRNALQTVGVLVPPAGSIPPDMLQRMCDIEPSVSQTLEECKATRADADEAAATWTFVRVWREWLRATAAFTDQEAAERDGGIPSAALADIERVALPEALKRGIKLFLHVGSATDAGYRPAADALQDSATLLAALPIDGCPWQHTLNTLATCYTQGAFVDWSAFYANCPGRRVELPTYAFQKKRFWLPATPLSDLAGELDVSTIEVHSHVGRRRPLAHEPETVLFEFRGCGPLGPDCDTIFPAMVRSAAAAVERDIEFRIEDAVLHAPFAFADGANWTLQVILRPEEPGRYQARIYSAAIPKASESPNWSLHYVTLVAP
jgi:acyl transferase domain-containing protein